MKLKNNDLIRLVLRDNQPNINNKFIVEGNCNFPYPGIFRQRKGLKTISITTVYTISQPVLISPNNRG